MSVRTTARSLLLLGAGLAMSCVEHTAPPERGLVTEDLEEGVDGSVDTRYLCEFDADGNRVLEESDLDVDGRVDYRVTSTYDEQGKLLTRDDGTLDFVVNDADDAEGYRESRDDDATTWVYDCDVTEKLDFP